MLSKNIYSDVNNLAGDWCLGADNKLDDVIVRTLSISIISERGIYQLTAYKVLRSCVSVSLSDVLEEITSDIYKRNNQ